MPFTLSHVAAVLPLRALTSRALPLGALAAGAMAPDLPFFQPFTDWRLIEPRTHSLMGLVTWDLLFGLGMWAAWRAGARPLHDLVPDVVRRRWRTAHWPTHAKGWLLVGAGVFVGSITHVAWDEFTHAARFGDDNVPALAAGYATPWGVDDARLKFPGSAH